MSQAARTVPVWDRFVRVFHWGLVACVALAWYSGDDWPLTHLVAGYIALALIALRIGWGFWGSSTARFAHFVKRPAAIFRYLGDIAAGREARYVGHNPAGGAMIVALLATLGGVCVTGWLLTTDAFWGTVTMEIIHEQLTNLALLLIAVHVAGVAIASIRHRENLVRSMLTGRKRAPDSRDIS